MTVNYHFVILTLMPVIDYMIVVNIDFEYLHFLTFTTICASKSSIAYTNVFILAINTRSTMTRV